MKKIGIAFVLLVIAGCHASDREIYADIAGKAQQDLNFTGLYFTVDHGVVNFTGRCPSEKALTEVRQTVKNIHVIKAVNYQVTIAPVALDVLTPVKLTTDSILSQYPQVTAEVKPGGITLKGEITGPEKAKLVKALTRRHIGPLKDSLRTPAIVIAN